MVQHGLFSNKFLLSSPLHLNEHESITNVMEGDFNFCLSTIKVACQYIFMQKKKNLFQHNKIIQSEIL